MSTEIVTLPDLSGAQGASMELFNEMVKSAFLPRISLMAGTSSLVQEGKIGVGQYAFIRAKDEFIDLGKTFNCYPVSWRFAALRFGNDTEKTKSYYDPQSEEFKQIVIDAQEEDSGCSYGPQFLIWCPQQKEFATYLFGSKSARPVARSMNQLLGTRKSATFVTKLAQAGKNKWPVPVVVPYSGAAFEMPTEEAARMQAEKFNNPPAYVEEEEAPAPPEGAAADARAR